MPPSHNTACHLLPPLHALITVQAMVEQIYSSLKKIPREGKEVSKPHGGFSLEATFARGEARKTAFKGFSATALVWRNQERRIGMKKPEKNLPHCGMAVNPKNKKIESLPISHSWSFPALTSGAAPCIVSADIPSASSWAGHSSSSPAYPTATPLSPGDYLISTMAAMPCPPPPHIVSRPYLEPRRFIS